MTDRRVPQFGHRLDYWTFGGLTGLRTTCAFEARQALEQLESAMRNTDPDPRPFQPLGDKVPKPSAPAPNQGWTKVRPGIWQGPDGKLATEPPQVKK